MVFWPSGRLTLSSRDVLRSPVVVRSMTVTSGVEGPSVMRAGAPTEAPGLTERSTELSLTVSAETSAP